MFLVNSRSILFAEFLTKRLIFMCLMCWFKWGGEMFINTYFSSVKNTNVVGYMSLVIGVSGGV